MAYKAQQYKDAYMDNEGDDKIDDIFSDSQNHQEEVYESKPVKNSDLDSKYQELAQRARFYKLSNDDFERLTHIKDEIYGSFGIWDANSKTFDLDFYRESGYLDDQQTPVDKFTEITDYYNIEEGKVDGFKLRNIQNGLEISDNNFPLKFKNLAIIETDFTRISQIDYKRLLRLIKHHTTTELLISSSTFTHSQITQILVHNNGVNHIEITGDCCLIDDHTQIFADPTDVTAFRTLQSLHVESSDAPDNTKTDALGLTFTRAITNPTEFSDLQLLKLTFEEEKNTELYKELVDTLRESRNNLYIECWIGLDEYKEDSSAKLKQIVNEDILKRAHSLMSRALGKKFGTNDISASSNSRRGSSRHEKSKEKVKNYAPEITIEPEEYKEKEHDLPKKQDSEVNEHAMGTGLFDRDSYVAPTKNINQSPVHLDLDDNIDDPIGELLLNEPRKKDYLTNPTITEESGEDSKESVKEDINKKEEDKQYDSKPKNYFIASPLILDENEEEQKQVDQAEMNKYVSFADSQKPGLKQRPSDQVDNLFAEDPAEINSCAEDPSNKIKTEKNNMLFDIEEVIKEKPRKASTSKKNEEAIRLATFADKHHKNQEQIQNQPGFDQPHYHGEQAKDFFPHIDEDSEGEEDEYEETEEEDSPIFGKNKLESPQQQQVQQIKAPQVQEARKHGDSAKIHRLFDDADEKHDKHGKDEALHTGSSRTMFDHNHFNQNDPGHQIFNSHNQYDENSIRTDLVMNRNSSQKGSSQLLDKLFQEDNENEYIEYKVPKVSGPVDYNPHEKATLPKVKDQQEFAKKEEVLAELKKSMDSRDDGSHHSSSKYEILDKKTYKEVEEPKQYNPAIQVSQERKEEEKNISGMDQDHKDMTTPSKFDSPEHKGQVPFEADPVDKLQLSGLKSPQVLSTSQEFLHNDEEKDIDPFFGWVPDDNLTIPFKVPYMWIHRKRFLDLKFKNYDD